MKFYCQLDHYFEVRLQQMPEQQISERLHQSEVCWAPLHDEGYFT